MARDNVAPWAELVPGQSGLMTVDELLALPEDGWRYELVDGRLVRLPLRGGEQGVIALELAVAVGNWVKAHGLGRLLAAGTGFQLGPNTVLAANVAYVRSERIPAPGSAGRERYWMLAPDLVAEVASPGQTHADLEVKARTWLGAGVRLVWNVWPKRQQVDVWRLDAAGVPQLVATLKPGDALDGLDVLPGFTYPLAELFS